MKWPTVPRFMPLWLRNYPLLLAQVLAVVNVVRGPAPTNARRKVFAIAAVYLLGMVLIAVLAVDGRATLAVETALRYGGVVAAASGLYALSLVSTLKQRVENALARSWLAATPLSSRRSKGTAVLLFATAIFGRYLVVFAVILLAALDSSVSVQQSLQLTALAAGGGSAGALLAGAFSRRRRRRRSEDSRYTLRPPRAANLLPSSRALSRWPIAQAFAWSRPENTRILLGAIILTVPGGTGILGSLAILVAWGLGSYLVAVLTAIPCVARTASGWLRSTPISFWGFAWPLARRALLHQLCGTLIAIVGLILVGLAPETAIYLGAIWMTLVVTTAAIGLADCYRSRSPIVKTAASVVGALLAEQRAHGWGILLALLVAVLHLRAGVSHERA